MSSTPTSRGTRLSVTVLIAAGIAGAQVYPPGGGYPGGGYPYPGRYPGGTGGGSPLPIPGRRGQPTASKDPTQPLPSFRGALKRFDDKGISLELGDNRVLDFRRTGKTKFFKAGEEIKSPKLNLGDEVSIEASEEPGGYMTAVNVYWEKAAGAPAGTDTAKRSPERDKADGVPDTWAKDDPDRPVLRRNDAPAPAGSAGTPKDDPDRPVLRRNDPSPPAAASGGAPKDDPDRPVLRRKDSPSAATASEPPQGAPPVQIEPAGPAKPVASAEKAPPPARSDDDDEGRPILRRGGPSSQRAAAPPRPVERAEAKPTAEPVFRTVEEPGEGVPVVRRGQGDDLIRRATDAAVDFIETLPAYVVQEMMTRYQGEGKPVRWQAQDVVTMNLVYENGREDYRDIKVNGKPKQSLDETGGAWSTGEFGTVLIDLFSPATATDFVYARETRINGIPAKVYDFSVARENSHWSIKMGSQSYNPPYKGSVWIDPKNGRVMRIEMQAYGFPGAFPADHVESATDYQYIRLGDTKQYLLPVKAETLTCQRGTDYCSRNTIEFRNYRKYSGEATITFEPMKDK